MKRYRYWVTLIIFWSGTAIAMRTPTSCRDELRSFQPNGYLVGLLVETNRYQIILGFTKLIGSGHEGLAHKISAKYGVITAYGWGGEALVGDGQILTVNDTSGTLQRMRVQVVGSQVENLKETLRAYAPDLLNPTATFHQYGSDHQHLDQQFEGLIQIERTFGITSAIRHDIIGTVERAMASIDLLNTSALRNVEPRQSLLMEIETTFALTSRIADYVCLQNTRIKDELRIFRALEIYVRSGKKDWWKQAARLRRAKQDLRLLSSYLKWQLDPDNDDIYYFSRLR